MKFIKISLYILGGLLLVGLAGAAVFIATFDANDYRPQISAQVKQQTGRDIVLGDIKPAVFPWLGIELQQLSLSNAKGFEAKQMLQIEKLDVRVAFLPLLKGEVKIDTLRVHGLQLALAKDAQGKTNWDDILQKQSSRAAPAGEPQVKADKQSSQTGPALSALLVNGIEIKDASIRWHDALTKQQVALQKFNLETGAIRSGQAFPLKLSTHVELSEPKAGVDVSLQTEVNYDLQLQALQLSGFELAIDAALKDMGVSQAKINLHTQLAARLKQQTFSLPDIDMLVMARGEALPGGEIKAQLNSAAEINLQAQTAKVSKLNIKTLGLAIQSQLSLTQFIDSPQAKGKLSLQAFNPAKLLKQLQVKLPAMQSQQALQHGALSFAFSGDTTSLKLTELDIELDKSRVGGELSVAQFTQPALEYQLSLDSIKLDDYLPPPVEPVKSASAKPSGAKPMAVPTDTPIDLPVEMLRGLDITGRFNAKKIQAFEQLVTDLRIDTQARGGLIKLPVVKAKLLDGTVNATAQLDVRQSQPKYAFTVNGKNLEADSVASPILQDLLGEKDVRLTGKSALELNITTQGKSVNQLKANSNGQLRFNMGKAELHEVDIEYYVRTAVAGYLDEKNIPVKQRVRGEYKPKDTTALNIVRASASIKNGVLANRDLLLDSARFKVTGAGTVNLPEETLNYRAVLDVTPANIKTTGEKILDVPVPVRVKGGFSQPAISIEKSTWFKNIGKVLKTEARAAVKKKADKKIEKARDKLKDKYKDKLKSLFR